MMEEWEPKYKCNDCNDSGFVWTVRADGTREMVMCHCHPLVRSGKAKPWEVIVLSDAQSKRKAIIILEDRN